MRKIFVLLSACALSLGIHAQNADDPVVFEINGKNIHKSEFMKEFLRSVGKDPADAPTACTYEKRKALEEYVDLFVNYRIKLEDAYAMGYDTMPDMVKELAGYRNELAAPYLIDSLSLNNILHEAYDRNHYVLHAAHILVKFKGKTSPEDTLAAYKRAMSYYDRLVKGESFEDLALESAKVRAVQDGLAPDDPRRNDNGDLGNFTVFDMVYPFESAAYGLKEGEFSKPVRTNFGYHIVKLYSKVPYFGKSTFQHIWIAPRNVEGLAESRIRAAYKSIQEGANFGVVCNNYSDDQATAQNGGMLNDMAINQIPPEYVTVMSKLQPGEMSEPFETSYGWHILLLNRRDSIPSFEDMVPYYKQRLVRDKRSTLPRLQFIEQCKSKYDFKDYTQIVDKPAGKKAKKNAKPAVSLDVCVAAIDTTVFTKEWKYDGSVADGAKTIVSVAEKNYTVDDFMKYIESHQRSQSTTSLKHYVDDRYANFINDVVFEYADTHLESEYSEFAELVGEYRNGLMIFYYNDKMIWSKAILDTVGLDDFYKMHSQLRSIDNEEDAPYFWNERAKVTVFTISDSAAMAPAKALKIVNKAVKKNLGSYATADMLNAKVAGDVKWSSKESVVEREHQNILGNNQWKTGVYEESMPAGYRIVVVNEVMPPTLKSRAEARGFYVNDYQNYLEQQLISQLRKKYNVVIHQDVVDEITY